MVWLQSHRELANHPKTRKAAHKTDVSIPTMIGHLHLLWWWALDFAPDGDLSKFDDEDIAYAALWEGDPETFVAALVGCGSGGGNGFIDSGRCLHDWEEYGGKYRRRVESAKKAAGARWNGPEVHEPECERNANALPSHSNRNAEERRGEKKRNKEHVATVVSTVSQKISDEAKELAKTFATAVYRNGSPVPSKGSKAHDSWLLEFDRLLRIGPPGGDRGADPLEVGRVIVFATTDDFWKCNVLSAKKFREHYPRLRLLCEKSGPVVGRLGTGGVG